MVRIESDEKDAMQEAAVTSSQGIGDAFVDGST